MDSLFKIVLSHLTLPYVVSLQKSVDRRCQNLVLVDEYVRDGIFEASNDVDGRVSIRSIVPKSNSGIV